MHRVFHGQPTTAGNDARKLFFGLERSQQRNGTALFFFSVSVRFTHVPFFFFFFV